MVMQIKSKIMNQAAGFYVVWGQGKDERAKISSCHSLGSTNTG